MSKLWKREANIDASVESFTVGKDRELDLRLAPYDIKGSLAHIKMLNSIALITDEEFDILKTELNKILKEIEEGSFLLEEGVEDIHSQVEILLTRRVGEIGKKIHSGRSRNDQVLTDIKLYLKDEVYSIKESVKELFELLLDLSEKHSEVLMPGYTHTQVAMPSSFGLWFGAYAESLIDDMHILCAAYKIVDQSPLGSAAGYGNSFPLDRDMSAKELGFFELSVNSIAAQLSRGKSEKGVAMALSSIASTINKLASDAILFMSGNFNFISLPEQFTTGSSIMPHKKNPDVWEIIRGRTNMLLSLPNQISLLTTNIMHGYHRDFQLLKEILFPAIDSLHNIIEMTLLMLQNIVVNTTILENKQYDHLFTVEEVNRLVIDGIPFREAYLIVSEKVAKGKFVANKKIAHTHKGSIGNLCNSEIRAKMERAADF